ncbi:MAG TPA: chemotaxis protein CheB [Polyangia bacterium]|nr:chemotaxis protein CheB [Polyangia bacterium]
MKTGRTKGGRSAKPKRRTRRSGAGQPAEPSPFPVVGVGASAGGLEAFSRLLSKIPGDTPLAVILVQHLSPTHESHLPELLESSTTLPVRQARDGMAIEPAHVYVTPPGAQMGVASGKLVVGQRPTDKSQYTPIDYFFGALASAYQERAIAVILSGTASDGAMGLGAVKGAGGITFVQDPAEAKFDSMPRAAMAAGAADAVLPVDRIAAELVRLCRHPFLLDARPRVVTEGERAPSSLRQVFQILRKSSGVDFTHYKLPTILRRIQRRMALHRLVDLESYTALLRKQPQEADDLYEDLLIHVTGFFREPEAFASLKAEIFPRILRAREGDKPIRAWVPGCSSGEEVYSLAIALYEFLGDNADNVPFQIFGTDVSQRMVDRARGGAFLESSAQEIGAARLRRFFTMVEGKYRINKSLREHCVFSRQDLTRDPPFSKLDLIVCRNLLIYLGYPLQRKVMSVFHYGLKPTGFLMLGRSETTSAHSDLFTLVDKKQKIYSKKPVALTGHLEFASSFPEGKAPERPPPAQPVAPGRDEGADVNRLILDRYGPPGVLVDLDFHIVRTRGRTGRYLELAAGEAKLDLLKMVREGLLSGLRTALREARSRNAHVRKENLRVRSDGDPHAVNLDVTPIGTGADRRFLVLFEEPPRKAAGAGAPAARRRKGTRRSNTAETIKQLETELVANREYLQSIIEDLEGANEELQSANEEILSSNEELQSTNEELDTAREELQSTNEELNTLNEELRSRNEELSRANGDLTNLLASIHVATVMVTTDLRIRRFTPAAERMLNLIPGDLGRPIAHIKPNIQCPNLEELIADAIDKGAVREREVTDQQGNIYLLRIRPYKSVDNKIDGAVLTLVDVSGAKVGRKVGEAIMEVAEAPILLMDERLRIIRGNRAFDQAFDVSTGKLSGRELAGLGEGAWQDPDLLRSLQKVSTGERRSTELELAGEFVPGRRMKAGVAVRRIESDEGGSDMILMIVRDVEEVADA